jgi:hypothetical protein
MQAMNLQSVKNNSTRKSLTKDVKDFAAFCKGQGLHRLAAIEDAGCQSVIQAYADRMVEEGHYSKNSMHRKLAAPCKALAVNMGDIDKPRRTQSTITRGRREPSDQAKRGDKEQSMDRYSRLVTFQKAVGIRRAELAHLRGRDLVKDESGWLCVRVENGKGGKEQLQRILPADFHVVRETFADIAPDQRVFSKAEMQNHINLHGLRAGQGKRAYDYYTGRLAEDPSYGRELIGELIARYRAAHPRGEAAGSVRRWLASVFGLERPGESYMQQISGAVYLLRGENRQRAIASGRPTEYSRLALLAVSVFHLSHWRLDVTVTNYLLA